MLVAPPAPDEAPPVAAVPPLLGVAGVPAEEGELAAPPLDGVAEADEDAEDGVAAALEELVSVVDVVEDAVVFVEGVGRLATPVVGTVNGGAPLVFADGLELPPQAETQAAMKSTARTAMQRLMSASAR